MKWLFAAGASCAGFCLVSLGTLSPLHDPSGIQYVFVWSGASVWLTTCACVLLVLSACYALVRSVARRMPQAQVAAARSGRWLAPLAALGITALGILPAVPGVDERAAVVGYWFYDLRWWWALLLIGWTAVRVDVVLGSPLRRRLSVISAWSPASRLLLCDTVVFASLVLWAAMTTPASRFTSRLLGDEPKYVRFCELWYQGGGLDVSRKTLFADQRLDASPHVLTNGWRLMAALGEEARALPTDLLAFASDPIRFRWNRIEGSNGFLRGKHGGVYQVHQPGVSAVLFPGYFLDRYLFGFQAGYFGEFADAFVMTSLTMLIVYAACGVALFRLLRRALASDWLAGVWAMLATATMPATAFAFQFYPELPALLLVILVSTYALFHATSSRLATAGWAGAGAAALAWLHPRFLVLAATLAIVSMKNSSPERRRVFAMTFGLVLLSVMFYDYHVTGSWLPTALWAANHDRAPGFDVSWNLLTNLLGYAIDRTWGLLPHSPLLLCVVPGLLVLGRTSWRHALFVAIVVLALAIPAAGHTLSAAGTTPDRLVLAVVPLLVWPVAVVVRRFWSSMSVRVVTVVLVMLSLDAAFSYNWSNSRMTGALQDLGRTGWKPNLAFPLVRGVNAVGNVVLAISVLGLIVGASILAYRRSIGTEHPSPLRRAPVWLASIAIVPVFVVASFAATSASGDWTSDRYLLRDQQARHDAAEAMVALDRCRLCFTSQRSQVDWTWLQPNPASNPKIDVDVEGHIVKVRIRLDSDDRAESFGRVHVAFGDDSTERAGVVGEREIVHEYSRRGQFALEVVVQLPRGSHVERRTIDVGGK